MRGRPELDGLQSLGQQQENQRDSSSEGGEDQKVGIVADAIRRDGARGRRGAGHRRRRIL